jgi:hypothetical protein
MKPINVEILMGHSTGISDSYFRPTENELLDDYIQVVDLLTVNNLRVEFKNMQKLSQQEQVNTDAIASLSDQVLQLMQEIEVLKKQGRK